MPRIPSRTHFRENDFKIIYRVLDPHQLDQVMGYVGATKYRVDGQTRVHDEADLFWKSEEEAVAWLNSDR